MRPHHRLRRASSVAGIEVALLFGAQAQPAIAASTNIVFPIPVVGESISTTGLPTVGVMHITASTDQTTPGVTRFTGSFHCCVYIHWRNISTCNTGIASLEYPSVETQTGSGALVAAATVPTGPPGYPAIMGPGAGAWTVP